MSGRLPLPYWWSTAFVIVQALHAAPLSLTVPPKVSVFPLLVASASSGTCDFGGARVGARIGPMLWTVMLFGVSVCDTAAPLASTPTIFKDGVNAWNPGLVGTEGMVAA